MNAGIGDRVLVNVAPFVGSALRLKNSVACEVLEARGNQFHVRTEPPCREVTLWIAHTWIEGLLPCDDDEESLALAGQE